MIKTRKDTHMDKSSDKVHSASGTHEQDDDMSTHSVERKYTGSGKKSWSEQGGREHHGRSKMNE